MDPHSETFWNIYADVIRRSRPGLFDNPTLFAGPEEMMHSLSRVAQRLGMPRPHRVEGPEAAVAHLRLEPTSLLVLTLRRDPAAITTACEVDPDLPIISLSIDADPKLMRDCLHAGAAAHLVLPATPERWADALVHAAVRGADCGSQESDDEMDATLATVLAELPTLPSLRQLSDALITEALKRCGGVTSHAAKLLKVTPQAIFNRRRRSRQLGTDESEL
jgi:DNA-binding NtrC family response regulator